MPALSDTSCYLLHRCRYPTSRKAPENGSEVRMAPVTVFLYGWGNKPIHYDSEEHSNQVVEQLLLLGPDDCAVLTSSTDDCDVSLYRRYKDECGLLESCFNTCQKLPIHIASCSKNIIAYADSNHSLWFYDANIVGDRLLDSSQSGSGGITADVHVNDSDLNREQNNIIEKKKITREQNDDEEVLGIAPTESANKTNKRGSSGLILEQSINTSDPFLNFRHNLIGCNIIVKQIATGDSHCLILTDSSELFSVGSGNCGELGVGYNIPHTDELRKIIIYENRKYETVKYIAAGSYYSAVITTRGSLYTFGSGAYYRLGHGTDENCVKPTRVEALEGVGDLLPNGTSTGIALVSCGIFHTVAIASDTHDVYAWGWNKFGQCGSTPGANNTSGVNITGGTNVPSGVKVPDGVNSSSGVNVSGGVKVAGGVNPPGGRSSSFGFEALSEPRRVMELDDDMLVGDDDISDVSCGSRHTALLTRNSSRILIMGVLGCTSSMSTSSTGETSSTNNGQQSRARLLYDNMVGDDSDLLLKLTVKRSDSILNKDVISFDDEDCIHDDNNHNSGNNDGDYDDYDDCDENMSDDINDNYNRKRRRKVFHSLKPENSIKKIERIKRSGDNSRKDGICSHDEINENGKENGTQNGKQKGKEPGKENGKKVVISQMKSTLWGLGFLVKK